MDLDFGIVVALPQYPALALLDVPRSPWRIEVVESDEPLLHVRPGAHFFGGAQQDADAAGIHGVKQCLLLAVRIGVMDVGDFLCRNASGDELVAKLVINVEAIRIGCREVAENKLRQSLFLSCRPRSVNLLDGAARLRIVWLGEGIDQAHIERGLSSVAGDLEHVVHGRIDLRCAEFLRAVHERPDIGL
jgi:hypothetical protein